MSGADYLKCSQCDRKIVYYTDDPTEESVGVLCTQCAVALSSAIDNIRDAVLHDRGALAEMDIDCEITNAVLNIIDSFDPRPERI